MAAIGFRHESAKPSPQASEPRRARRRWLLLWFLLAWAVAAYLIAPRLWRTLFLAPHGDLRGGPDHPHLGRPPRRSGQHRAGGQRNRRRERAAWPAGWFPADPITFDSSVRIAADSVLRRPDDDAPVSPLYLFGRKQDLAFERPVGGGPRQRHHVRFWRWDQAARRPARMVWLGDLRRARGLELHDRPGHASHRPRRRRRARPDRR